MKHLNKPLNIALLLLSMAGLAQNKKHILLSNGIAHVGNGQVVENSLVSFKDGKIEMVADARVTKIDISSFDTVINVAGKHIYPALIAPNCILGLQEAEAVRATSDFSEVGGYNPHVRSVIAYNTDSKILPTIRCNGVLYTQATPRSGVISGSSSVLATDGWNWEDALLKADDGIHVNFPKSIQKNGWWTEPQPSNTNSRYTEQLNDLVTFFEHASGYCKSTSVTETNLRYEAMRGVFNGTQNLYLHADYVKDIISAVNMAKQFGIKKPVIVGGKESYKVTKLLRENHVPVMINRLHDLPDLAEDDVDAVYKLPFLLQKDSVLFCLQNQGDMEAMNARNIPFLAGTAATYGLSKEEALQSITLSSAKILGVDNLIGSLENGKLASVVVSEGDILDMRTSQVILAFINGRLVQLDNFQKALYTKYMNKYGLKE
ncbi:MAG: amidohydrolase family protein [Bacteroidetes bacterium]|nr:amidohydrolase family protein [Bacteroidota bacterium]